MQPLPVTEAFVKGLEDAARLPQKGNRFPSLLKAFLASDFHLTSTGSLPHGIKSMQSCLLPGRHFLQIDEVVNIGANLKGRFEEKGKDRTLKFHLTDGKQQVIGFEYKHIPSLKVLDPAGCKILVTDVFVHRGIMMLCPENVEVLGGSVARLIRAQEETRKALQKEQRPGRERQNIGQLYKEAELKGWEFEFAVSPHIHPSPIQSLPDELTSLRQIQKSNETAPVIPNKENAKPSTMHVQSITVNQDLKDASRVMMPYSSARQQQCANRSRREATKVETRLKPAAKRAMPQPCVFDVIDLLDDE